MRTLSSIALLALGALALSTATPAFAEPSGDSHGEHAEGGHADGGHGDAHGDDAHGDGHGDAHGGDHGHHALTAWGDDNGNGTPNFLDTEDDHFANSWGHPVWLQWIWHGLNLLVLLGGIGFLVRKPIGAALRDRSLEVQRDLDESAAREAEARAKFEELERRLQGFEAEVAAMREEAARAAATEKAEIEARAQDAATRIGQAAERAIRDETARARRELRAEAVELAVQQAEETLRKQVGNADRQRLAEDLLTSLGAQGGKHG